MGSVPLLCNICPKRPDFSDISHLLTHVGSKGHLSHYFKAQVRSRQEPAVRRELDIYDRWYDQHQIEKLLSHRMVLKESKDTQSKPKAGRKLSSSTKSGIATKQSQRAQPVPQRSPVNLSVEDLIDPQLSQLQSLPTGQYAPRPMSPSCDQQVSEIASMHRAHVPRMQQQENTSLQDFSQNPNLQADKRHQRKKTCSDTWSDTDCVSPQSQDLIRVLHPDPTIQACLLRSHSYNRSSPSMNIESRDFLPSPVMDHGALELFNKNSSDDNWSIFDEASLAQSPILKGVQWPGMNIFDSASPEAQRKRNQKKNNSVMMQMEINSTAVEPLERIYWPEGGLKKERIITGNVESSPIKEPTPKPKRRRMASNRQVLGDLSTNEWTLAKRYKSQKRPTKTTISGESDLGDLSKRGPAMLDTRAAAALRSAHSRLDCVENEVDWRLGMEDHRTERKADFLVFEDDMEDARKRGITLSQCNSKVRNYPFLQSMQNVSGIAPSHMLPFHNLELPFTATQPHSPPCTGFGGLSPILKEPNGRSSHPSERPYPVPVENKENTPSFFDQEGQPGDEPRQAISERQTQRYFSVTEAHPPQFFDFLPPQMDFGGLADSRFFTSSLNPLNPSAHFRQDRPLQLHNNGIARATTPVGRANRRKKPSRA